jgi:hypothetical protein
VYAYATVAALPKTTGAATHNYELRIINYDVKRKQQQ